MAQTAEGKVKVWLYGTTQKQGKLFEIMPGAYVYKAPGGMYGQAGAPDAMICWRGVFIGLEIKSTVGKPTELQLRHLRKITEAGGIGTVMYGKDEEKLKEIRDLVNAKLLVKP